MWFKFPKGTSSISCQLQTFVTEVMDEEGRGYFRAPDHFASILLSIPGFEAPGKVPEGAPEDLPRSDDKNVMALGQLSNQVTQLQGENENLRASLAETLALRDDLVLKLHETRAELLEVKEELEALQEKG